MRDADSVHNLSPTTVSYHAGVKAAMLRPPAFRTAFLLLLMLPFVTPVRRARAAVDPQVPASWVPQGFEALAQRAAFHTDFTFDRSMLQVANFFTGDDQDARNAIAKLNSITVHSYHFAAPGLYDPAGLDLVRRQAVGRLLLRVVGAPQHERPVGVAVLEEREHFPADPREQERARHVRLHHANRQAAPMIARALSVPEEADAHPALRVDVHLLARRAGHDRGLESGDPRPRPTCSWRRVPTEPSVPGTATRCC